MESPEWGGIRGTSFYGVGTPVDARPGRSSVPERDVSSWVLLPGWETLHDVITSTGESPRLNRSMSVDEWLRQSFGWEKSTLLTLGLEVRQRSGG
jgi:hypothetical protein